MPNGTVASAGRHSAAAPPKPRSRKAAFPGSPRPRCVELSVRLASDAEVRALNARWRGKDEPTNVLSFPMADEAAIAATAADGPELMLGDIVLARGVCAAEAAEKAIPIEDHAAHLIVHGTLHLLGYDHETMTRAADMEAREVRALARLGIADPLPRIADDGDANLDEGRLSAVARDAHLDVRRRWRNHAARPDRGSDRRSRAKRRSRGDLLPLERQMLRNLLDFGDRTAGEVAVTRGDIIAVPVDDQLRRARPPRSPRPATAACRSIGEASTTVIGMIHIKDVFIADRRSEPRPHHRRAAAHALVRPRIDGRARIAGADARQRDPPRHRRRRVRRHRGPRHDRGRRRGDRRRIEDEHDEASAGLLMMLEDGIWKPTRGSSSTIWPRRSTRGWPRR